MDIKENCGLENQLEILRAPRTAAIFSARVLPAKATSENGETFGTFALFLAFALAPDHKQGKKKTNEETLGWPARDPAVDTGVAGAAADDGVGAAAE